MTPRTSFHSEEYIAEKWSSYFEVLAVHTRHVSNQQDAVVCRRPANV